MRKVTLHLLPKERKMWFSTQRGSGPWQLRKKGTKAEMAIVLEPEKGQD